MTGYQGRTIIEEGPFERLLKIIRPKLTRKRKLLYYLLSFLIISILFYGFELRRDIAYTYNFGGPIGTVIGVTPDDRLVVTIGNGKCFGWKTIDCPTSPEMEFTYEIYTRPGDRFKGLAKYMKVGDHYELKSVRIYHGRSSREIWTWSTSRRIWCCFLLILSKFY